MTPPEALPSSTNGSSEEARERRKWHAFWQELPGWLKAAIMAAAGLTLGGGTATGLLGGGKKVDDRLLTLEVKVDKMAEQQGEFRKDYKEDMREIMKALRRNGR